MVRSYPWIRCNADSPFRNFSSGNISDPEFVSGKMIMRRDQTPPGHVSRQFMHAIANQASHSPCSLPPLPWAAWTSVATLGYDRPRDSKQKNLQSPRHATASPERAVAQTRGQRTLPMRSGAPWPRCWMTAPFLLEFREALASFENERRV